MSTLGLVPLIFRLGFLSAGNGSDGPVTWLLDRGEVFALVETWRSRPSCNKTYNRPSCSMSGRIQLPYVELRRAP